MIASVRVAQVLSADSSLAGDDIRSGSGTRGFVEATDVAGVSAEGTLGAGVPAEAGPWRGRAWPRQLAKWGWARVPMAVCLRILHAYRVPDVIGVRRVCAHADQL